MAASYSGGILGPCDAFDNNAALIDISLWDANITTNGVLTINRNNGTTSNNTIPFFPDFVISGLTTSIAGLNVTYTGGTYQINGQVFSIGAGGVIAINANHPTDPRYDIIYVDTVSAVPLYLAGIASPTPTPPALPPNSLLIATIGVDSVAAGSGTSITSANLNNIPLIIVGTADNQTLRWSTVLTRWVPASGLQSNGTQVRVGTGIIATGVNDEALQLNTATQIFNVAIPAVTTNKLYANGGNLFWNGISLNSGSVPNGLLAGDTLYWNGAAWSATSVVQFNTQDLELTGGAIEINSYTPGITTNKIYNSAGDLYWNGIKLSEQIADGTIIGELIFWNGSDWIATGSNGTLAVSNIQLRVLDSNIERKVQLNDTNGYFGINDTVTNAEAKLEISSNAGVYSSTLRTEISASNYQEIVLDKTNENLIIHNQTSGALPLEIKLDAAAGILTNTVNSSYTELDQNIFRTYCGIVNKVRTVNLSGNITLQDHIILIDTAAAITLTINSGFAEGAELIFKGINGLVLNTILDPSGATNIEGTATVTMTNPYEIVKLIKTSTEWVML